MCVCDVRVFLCSGDLLGCDVYLQMLSQFCAISSSHVVKKGIVGKQWLALSTPQVKKKKNNKINFNPSFYDFEDK